MICLENIAGYFSSFKYKSPSFQGRVLTSNIADAYAGGFLLQISGKEQVACG